MPLKAAKYRGFGRVLEQQNHENHENLAFSSIFIDETEFAAIGVIKILHELKGFYTPNAIYFSYNPLFLHLPDECFYGTPFAFIWYYNDSAGSI
jgi:hypothetical protein